MADYAEVAQKVDKEEADLEKDGLVLDALEADLEAAQAALDLANANYKQVVRWVAKETAKGLDKDAGPTAKVYTKEPEVDTENSGVTSAEQKTEKASHGEKNTSAQTKKEVGRSKFDQKQAKELRVRENVKKGKERLRRSERDAKYASADSVPEREPPAAAAAAAAPTEQKGPAEGEDVAVFDGAKTVAERMKTLKDLPNAADKRSTLLKVLMGSLDNYFSSDPAEVVLDLQERGLVDAALASECMALLNEVAPVKGPAVSPEEWLEHAKKVADLKRPDEKPVGPNELAYLKFIDEKHLKYAEAELASAEAHLAELVQLSDSWYPAQESPSSKPAPAPVIDEVKVDLDKAAGLEDQNARKSESKGGKNTSTLSSKIVSKEKWLDARASEKRERENKTKARQRRRAECLDGKRGEGGGYA